MSTSWEKLIAKHCPTGMRVCNCRQAYETLLPPEISGTVCNGQPVAAWRCIDGCSAAQAIAKEIVATAIMEQAP